MIYPENYESKIGFNDIKALLSGFCQSELGRERVGELQMLTEVITKRWLIVILESVRFCRMTRRV